jgi:hypothetical protein
MARARGASRDANPYRGPAPALPGIMPGAHKLTAEARLAMRLESAWRIGWEAVDRELSNAPAHTPDPRRRVDLR